MSLHIEQVMVCTKCVLQENKPLSWPGAHWVRYEGGSEPTW